MSRPLKILICHVGVQVIPGKEDACISCLAWVRDPLDGTEALISGGLDGILTEWDLAAKVPRHLGDSFGGVVWDIAVQPDSHSEQGALPWPTIASNGFATMSSAITRAKCTREHVYCVKCTLTSHGGIPRAMCPLCNAASYKSACGAQSAGCLMQVLRMRWRWPATMGR